MNERMNEKMNEKMNEIPPSAVAVFGVAEAG